MNKKVKSIISFAIIAAFFVTMVTACWAVPSKQYSDSERRELAQFPKVDIKTLLDGSFMTKFESYTQDQFPLREKFRTLKAMMSYYVFRQLDNNDIYNNLPENHKDCWCKVEEGFIVNLKGEKKNNKPYHYST